MNITLRTSLNGRPMDGKKMKEFTYRSEVVSQMVHAVNRRMQGLSPNDGKGAVWVEM